MLSDYNMVKLYYSEISNGIHEIDDVWNQSDNEIVPDKKYTHMTPRDRSHV